MGEKWFEEQPDDTFKSGIDRIYEQAFARIRAGLAQGLGFDAACESIEVSEEELRRVVIDDMLKVLIAELHFTKQAALEDLAKSLKLPVERLEEAKKEMFAEVEKASAEVFYRNGGAGTA